MCMNKQIYLSVLFIAMIKCLFRKRKEQLFGNENQ